MAKCDQCGRPPFRCILQRRHTHCAVAAPAHFRYRDRGIVCGKRMTIWRIGECMARQPQYHTVCAIEKLCRRVGIEIDPEGRKDRSSFIKINARNAPPWYMCVRCSLIARTAPSRCPSLAHKPTARRGRAYGTFRHTVSWFVGGHGSHPSPPQATQAGLRFLEGHRLEQSPQNRSASAERRTLLCIEFRIEICSHPFAPHDPRN